MVRVHLDGHPLTATAAVAWSGDLPRHFQQLLFETAERERAPSPGQGTGDRHETTRAEPKRIEQTGYGSAVRCRAAKATLLRGGRRRGELRPRRRAAVHNPARLLAAADAARQPLRYLAPGFTADRDAAAHAAGQARDVLGGDRFTQAQKEGQGLALDDAVAYATRKGGGRKRPAAGWASLTPAEREVVRLAGEGLRNEAIARRLFIAPATVKVHLTHIFAKLGITTRTELAAQAAARNLTARSSGELTCASVPRRHIRSQPEVIRRPWRWQAIARRGSPGRQLSSQ